MIQIFSEGNMFEIVLNLSIDIEIFLGNFIRFLTKLFYLLKFNINFFV